MFSGVVVVVVVVQTKTIIVGAACTDFFVFDRLQGPRQCFISGFLFGSRGGSLGLSLDTRLLWDGFATTAAARAHVAIGVAVGVAIAIDANNLVATRLGAGGCVSVRVRVVACPCPRVGPVRNGDRKSSSTVFERGTRGSLGSVVLRCVLVVVVVVVVVVGVPVAVASIALRGRVLVVVLVLFLVTVNESDAARQIVIVPGLVKIVFVITVVVVVVAVVVAVVVVVVRGPVLRPTLLQTKHAHPPPRRVAPRLGGLSAMIPLCCFAGTIVLAATAEGRDRFRRLLRVRVRVRVRVAVLVLVLVLFEQNPVSPNHLGFLLRPGGCLLRHRDNVPVEPGGLEKVPELAAGQLVGIRRHREEFPAGCHPALFLCVLDDVLASSLREIGYRIDRKAGPVPGVEAGHVARVLFLRLGPPAPRINGPFWFAAALLVASALALALAIDIHIDIDIDIVIVVLFVLVFVAAVNHNGLVPIVHLFSKAIGIVIVSQQVIVVVVVLVLVVVLAKVVVIFVLGPIVTVLLVVFRVSIHRVILLLLLLLLRRGRSRGRGCGRGRIPSSIWIVKSRSIGRPGHAGRNRRRGGRQGLGSLVARCFEWLLLLLLLSLSLSLLLHLQLQLHLLLFLLGGGHKRAVLELPRQDPLGHAPGGFPPGLVFGVVAIAIAISIAISIAIAIAIAIAFSIVSVASVPNTPERNRDEARHVVGPSSGFSRGGCRAAFRHKVGPGLPQSQRPGVGLFLRGNSKFDPAVGIDRRDHSALQERDGGSLRVNVFVSLWKNVPVVFVFVFVFVAEAGNPHRRQEENHRPDALRTVVPVQSKSEESDLLPAFPNGNDQLYHVRDAVRDAGNRFGQDLRALPIGAAADIERIAALGGSGGAADGEGNGGKHPQRRSCRCRCCCRQEQGVCGCVPGGAAGSATRNAGGGGCSFVFLRKPLASLQVCVSPESPRKISGDNGSGCPSHFHSHSSGCRWSPCTDVQSRLRLRLRLRLQLRQERTAEQQRAEECSAGGTRTGTGTKLPG